MTNCLQCKRYFPEEKEEYLCAECFMRPKLLPSAPKNYIDPTPTHFLRKIEILRDYCKTFEDDYVTDKIKSLIKRDKWTIDELEFISDFAFSITRNLNKEDVGDLWFERLQMKVPKVVIQKAKNTL